MSRNVQIWNYDHKTKVTVPNALLRLCAQCLNAMRIDHYYWTSEDRVTIVYLCEHPGTSRFKSVDAKLDKMGRLS